MFFIFVSIFIWKGRYASLSQAIRIAMLIPIACLLPLSILTDWGFLPMAAGDLSLLQRSMALPLTACLPSLRLPLEAGFALFLVSILFLLLRKRRLPQALERLSALCLLVLVLLPCFVIAPSLAAFPLASVLAPWMQLAIYFGFTLCLFLAASRNRREEHRPHIEHA